MKNRILSLLLAVALLCAIVPQFTLSARAENLYAGTCGENLTWQFDPNTNTLTIAGSGAMSDDNYAYVGQPWSRFEDQITTVVLSDELTALSAHVFEGHRNLRTVRLSKSLTGIPDGAFFDCDSLEELELPETVASIGAYAFKNCTSLKSIRIPEGVTEIPEEAFQCCNSLESVQLPATVAGIGNAAFRDCTALLAVSFPASLTVIGDWAFNNCTALNTLTFSEGLKSIGYCAFSDCEGLQTLSFPAGLLEIRDSAFWRCAGLTTVRFQNGPLTIGDFAFSECCRLSVLLLPEGLSTLGAYAFAECSALPEIFLPASLTEIGEMAFYRCNALTGIHVEPENPAYSSDAAGALFDREQTRLIQYPCRKTGAYVIPNGVTVLEPFSFASCVGLSDISFPESLNSICRGAFLGCTGLTALTLPAHLLSIDDYGFHGCSSLETVNFPDGLTEVGAHAFEDCRSLTAVALPKSLASIGVWAFGFQWVEWQDEEEIGIMQSKVEGFTISCYTPSAAWDYARENDFRYVLLNSPFADVTTGKYFYDAVLWAYAHQPQITGGTDATHFSPSKSCTRAEVVTFLWNAFGKPEPELTNASFVDVKQEKYYYKAVLWAAQTGVTGGVDATHFNPNGSCTRAQIITFLWAAMKKPAPSADETPFEDVPATKYYTNAVRWANENGVTGGTDATHFSPSQTCTRAQVITFLYKLFGDR